MPDALIVKRSRKSLIGQEGNRRFTREMLELMSYDVPSHYDEFWAYNASNGYTANADAGATGLAVDAGSVNGLADQRSGATNDERAYFTFGGLKFHGDRNAVLAVRLKVDTVANTKMEVGFTDAMTEGAALGIVNVLDTPTFTATDAAVWVYDTDATIDRWQATGVKNGTAAAVLQPSATEVGPSDTVFETLVVALREDTARFLHFDTYGDLTYDRTLAGTATASVLLTPWVLVQSRTTATRIQSIDAIWVWQRRYS